MFEAKRILYLYVESPLHAGTGRGLGGIDLPIQRERTTDYPMVYGGGLKGCLRAETQDTLGDLAKTIFGPETGNASAHAGALAPHDARILLFPIRSLAGVYAWTTSVDVLQRFVRAADLTGEALTWQAPGTVADRQALVAPDSALITGGKVVLEDFAFAPQRNELVGCIGGWLAENALPGDAIYRYWREQLPRRLCILPNEAFCDFARLSTEIATRVQLGTDSKTVVQGPWTEEYLPVDTLLYAPLLASKARDGSGLSAAEVLARLESAAPGRLQLGGDETIGRGLVRLRFGAGGVS